MTLGSFFNGISGWILAGEKYGVKTLWESEIDDYCQAVTHHHFPEVKQLGDITKINADDLEPVDIICAGSPCQDLSVAGKREGLAGERSGLFVDAIKLVYGLRERTGKPRFFVWENVPGAFSSNKGMDFRAVLEEVSQTSIPIPANSKWAESGVVEWGEGSLAWRVLDAQYWGVPQRRKRIFLVADFGGFTAGEILFESQGLPRDSAEGERKGQETAADVGTITDSASETLTPFIPKKARCLMARMDGSPCIDRGPQIIATQVPVVHTIAGNIIGRDNKNGGHQLGIGHDVRPTLNTVDRHAVAYSMGQDVEQNKVVFPAGKVRRLTPTECERLQGLPDGYTDIELKGKPAPDSKRYKALGNGMAQPCADYVIKRIMDNYIGNA